MMGWLILVGALISIAVAGLGLRRGFQSKLERPSKLLLWVSSLVLGGGAGFSIGYPLNEKTQIYGFPFPAAIFQREPNGQWLDYVGPLTMPFALMNAMVGAGVFLYLALAIASHLAKRRRPDSPWASA
jgi:hypothetical protein